MTGQRKFDGGVVVGGRIGGALLVVVVLGLLALLPASALGKPKPKVAVSFPNAGEGAPLTFNWTAKHLGGAKLVIQRPVGTAHVWKTMQRLTGSHGSGSLPGQSLGKYRYRIAALRGRFVLAQQAATVAVYGQVPFSVLLRNSGNESGVYATPTGSFPYALAEIYHLADAEETGTPTTMLSVAHNNCSAVHVVFALGARGTESHGKNPTFVGTVAVVQQTREPASATVPFNQTGSIDAELVPGQTWSIVASYVGHNEESVLFLSPWPPSLYVNGYAICDSTEPFSS